MVNTGREAPGKGEGIYVGSSTRNSPEGPDRCDYNQVGCACAVPCSCGQGAKPRGWYLHGSAQGHPCSSSCCCLDAELEAACLLNSSTIQQCWTPTEGCLPTARSDKR